MTEPWLLAALCAPVSLAAASWRGNVRALGAAHAISLAVALVLTAALARSGPLVSPLIGAAGLGLSLRADPLGVTLLGLVAVLGAVLVAFSQSYLAGDPRRPAFLSGLGRTLAAVQLLLLANNLLLLLAAWIGSSLCLHRLLLFCPARPRAQLAARKKFVAARAGEAFLLLACVGLYLRAATGELHELLGPAGAAPPLWIAGALVLAALLKSAQLPTQGWLLDLVEAPTPVSALLHAGVLNAGPFLVLRFAPVVGASPLGSAALIAVGGSTALLASLAMRSQPALKTSLAYSSSAHMGFSLLLSGLGLYPAALLHLAAHSLYKAYAFLAASSALEAPPTAAPRRARPLQVALALLTSTALVGAGLTLGGWLGLEAGPAHERAFALIVVLALVQLLTPAAATGTSPSVRLALLARALGVTLAFVALEALARATLGLPAPPPLGAPAAWAAGLVLGAFALLAALQAAGAAASPSLRSLHLHLRNGCYAPAAFDRLVGAYRRPAQERA